MEPVADRSAPEKRSPGPPVASVLGSEPTEEDKEPQSQSQQASMSEPGPSGSKGKQPEGPILQLERTESANDPGVGTATPLEIGTDSSPDHSVRDDADSAYGESVADSTMSLRSSFFNYIEENGRTYHAYKSGKYLLPNDAREQERLDLQHMSFKVMLDGELYLAPLQNPRRVLDIATGTGIWAEEFADKFPEAQVIGTDLSPIQPEYVPPNLRFEIHDAEDEWTFSEPFDYIHARAVVTCFGANRAVFAKAAEHLAPGGYLEVQDPVFPMRSDDGTYAGTQLEEWNRLMVEGMTRAGRDPAGAYKWAGYMRDAGFEDVRERSVYVPVNPWAKGGKNKVLGAISCQNMKEGVESLSKALLSRVMGWSSERIEVFLAGVRNDVKNKNIHSYGIVHFVYGRKPLVPPQAPSQGLSELTTQETSEP